MAGDLRDQLQTTLGTAFTLERELGGGGMSRVFLAQETRLGRTVVVKVLSTELSAGLSAERFEREIRLAAQLQHPSIVPVLSAGDSNGLPYYTMPFVTGLSLRAKLAEGSALPVAETVRILRDIARGLDYAHARGVVHRDIKPENVLLSGDGAVITDFGIAKALSESRSMAASATLTEAGTMIGTPQYMAPEQVAGDPNTDHRADLYAFGTTAYEMLAGKAPFQGRPPHQILAAHVSEVPKPIATLRTDTPAGLAALVMRCLEKDPARRPQSARELLEGLDAVGTPGTAHASPRGRPVRALAIAVVVVIAAVAVIVPLRRSPDATASDGATLAVVPFANVGGDSTQQYFADGISDELATAIGHLPGMRVASRSTAYRYRGRRDLDVRELGKALASRFLVQGSVFRAGDRLRVSAQLSDASTGVEIWSQSFERDFKDVLTVQDDISKAVAAALQTRVAPLARGGSAALSHGTADPEAYDLYLRGEFLLHRRSVPAAAASFEQAIARDASFGRAYAALSQTLELFPYYAQTPAAAVAERVRTAAGRALAIDSTLARAHAARAMMYMHALRWDSSDVEYARAIALEPGDAETRLQYGRFLYAKGDFARTMTEWERAKALDPSSGVISAWLSMLLAQEKKYPQALAEAHRAVELDSSAGAVALNTAEAFLMAGDTAEARRSAKRMPPFPPWSGVSSLQLANAGDIEPARRVVRELEAAHPRPWMGETALAFGYIAVGRYSDALSALDRATDAGEIWPIYLATSERVWDTLRPDPRWQALLRRVGVATAPSPGTRP